METNRLDEIANSLQQIARKVQARLDEKQTEKLRKLIQVGKDGQPESLCWECRLPSGDGGEHNFSILRIPWASLNPPQHSLIKELSIEFPCDVKKTKSHAPDEQQEYMIVPTGNTPSDKHNEQYLKLVVKANNDYIPELTINDQTIDEFLDNFDQQLLDKKRHRSKIVWGIVATLGVLFLAAMIAIFIL